MAPVHALDQLGPHQGGAGHNALEVDQLREELRGERERSPRDVCKQQGGAAGRGGQSSAEVAGSRGRAGSEREGDSRRSKGMEGWLLVEGHGGWEGELKAGAGGEGGRWWQMRAAAGGSCRPAPGCR